MTRIRILPCPVMLGLILFAGLGLSACGGGTAADKAQPCTGATAIGNAVTGAGQDATPIRPASAAGLDGKLVVGYQGWFGCPGDFQDNQDWQHWFVNSVGLASMTFDAMPSVRGLDAADLCETGLARNSGGTVKLFSAQSQRVVTTHFRWMMEQGIDGAAVQRFVTGLSNAASQRRTEKVLANVQAAAKRTAVSST